MMGEGPVRRRPRTRRSFTSMSVSGVSVCPPRVGVERAASWLANLATAGPPAAGASTPASLRSRNQSARFIGACSSFAGHSLNCGGVQGRQALVRTFGRHWRPARRNRPAWRSFLGGGGCLTGASCSPPTSAETRRAADAVPQRIPVYAVRAGHRKRACSG